MKKIEMLESIDDLASEEIWSINLSKVTGENNTYYDGYSSGVAYMAGKVRDIIREIEPDFDSKMAKKRSKNRKLS